MRFLPFMFAMAILIAFPFEMISAQSREFTKTVDLGPDGHLRIDTQRGSVRLTTWDQSRVEIVARIVPPDDVSESYAREAVEGVEIEVTGDARSISIRSNYQNVPYLNGRGDGSRRLPEIHYRIQAPRRINLDMDVERVDSVVEGIEGNIQIEAERGNVEGQNWTGNIMMRIERGELRLRNTKGSFDLDAERTNIRMEAAQITGNSRINVQRGSAELRLPENQGLTIDADVGSRGDFDSAFEITAKTFGAKRIRGTVNGGGPRLDIYGERSSFYLRKQ